MGEVRMKWVKRHPDAIIPERKTKKSAGYDIHSIEWGFIAPGETLIVETGIGWDEVPENWVGLVKPRSGHAFNFRIDTLAGVIDADYRKENDEIRVLLINHGKEPFQFKAGQSIAQMVITNYLMVDGDSRGDKPDRNGGFGSTDN